MHHLRLSSYHHQHLPPASPAIAATLAASNSTVNASLKAFIAHQIAAIVKTARTISYSRTYARMLYSKPLRRLLMHSDQKSTLQPTRKKIWHRRRVPPTRRTWFRPMPMTLKVQGMRSNTLGAAPARSPPVSRSTVNASR